jgi:hypothetical protein
LITQALQQPTPTSNPNVSDLLDTKEDISIENSEVKNIVSKKATTLDDNTSLNQALLSNTIEEVNVAQDSPNHTMHVTNETDLPHPTSIQSTTALSSGTKSPSITVIPTQTSMELKSKEDLPEYSITAAFETPQKRQISVCNEKNPNNLPFENFCSPKCTSTVAVSIPGSDNASIKMKGRMSAQNHVIANVLLGLTSSIRSISNPTQYDSKEEETNTIDIVEDEQTKNDYTKDNEIKDSEVKDSETKDDETIVVQVDEHETN